MNFNVGKIYIRPKNFITYRTIGAEYYAQMRKKMIERYNNKRERIFVQKEPKMNFVVGYGSFQNMDKIKWSPASYVVEDKKAVEMKAVSVVKKDSSSEDEWVDIKKSLWFIEVMHFHVIGHSTSDETLNAWNAPESIISDFFHFIDDMNTQKIVGRYHYKNVPERVSYPIWERINVIIDMEASNSTYGEDCSFY